jgi:hypothetical protein
MNTIHQDIDKFSKKYKLSCIKTDSFVKLDAFGDKNTLVICGGASEKSQIQTVFSFLEALTINNSILYSYKIIIIVIHPDDFAKTVATTYEDNNTFDEFTRAYAVNILNGIKEYFTCKINFIGKCLGGTILATVVRGMDADKIGFVAFFGSTSRVVLDRNIKIIIGWNRDDLDVGVGRNYIIDRGILYEQYKNHNTVIMKLYDGRDPNGLFPDYKGEHDMNPQFYIDIY